MAEVVVERATDLAGSDLKVKPPAPNHYAFVDSLRGLAIFGVIFHHCGPKIPGLNPTLSKLVVEGAQGVQLFFVMSAFTLFLSMGSRKDRDKFPIAAYSIRRFFRIAPLFYMGLIFYNLIFPDDDRIQGIGKSSLLCTLATLTFTNGWNGSWINRMVPGGWSIAVEMSFYLMVPWLYRSIKTLRSAICGTIIALIGAVVCKLVLTKVVPRIAGNGIEEMVNGLDYYWLPTQLPIFLMGITLFFILKPMISNPLEVRPHRLIDAFILLAISGYLLIGTTFSDTNLFLGHILTGVAFVLLAWSLFLFPNPLIVNRAVCYLGTISFSGYLTHFAVLKLVLGLMNRAGADSLVARSPNVAFLVVLLATLAGTVLVASVTYRLIELPGIQAGRRLIRLLSGRVR